MATVGKLGGVRAQVPNFQLHVTGTVASTFESMACGGFTGGAADASSGRRRAGEIVLRQADVGGAIGFKLYPAALTLCGLLEALMLDQVPTAGESRYRNAGLRVVCCPVL